MIRAGTPIALRIDEPLFGNEKLAIPAYVLLVVDLVVAGFFKRRKLRIIHSILLPGP